MHARWHVAGFPVLCHHVNSIAVHSSAAVRSPHVSRSTSTFGCLNIRSLLNEFEDVSELCRDRHIDLGLLSVTETWHDVCWDDCVMLDTTSSSVLVLVLPVLTTCLSTMAALLSSLPPTSSCHRSRSLTSQARLSLPASEPCPVSFRPSSLCLPTWISGDTA